MPALRILGLVVMAAFVFSIGSLGYLMFQALMRDRAAQDALSSAGEMCERAISWGREIQDTVSIPDGYFMKFTGNQITIDGHKYPEGGFSVEFEGILELGPGTHKLSIEISEGRLVVTRIS